MACSVARKQRATIKCFRGSPRRKRWWAIRRINAELRENKEQKEKREIDGLVDDGRYWRWIQSSVPHIYIRGAERKNKQQREFTSHERYKREFFESLRVRASLRVHISDICADIRYQAISGGYNRQTRASRTRTKTGSRDFYIFCRSSCSSIKHKTRTIQMAVLR